MIYLFDHYSPLSSNRDSLLMFLHVKLKSSSIMIISIIILFFHDIHKYDYHVGDAPSAVKSSIEAGLRAYLNYFF